MRIIKWNNGDNFAGKPTKIKSMTKNESYHGTTEVASNAIVNGSISVTMGGGELGQGFYTGTYIWEAKAWARMKHRSSAVVEISILDNDFYRLNIETLDFTQTSCLRKLVRDNKTTRTHLENVDVVWAPIVGSQRNKGDQYKWESIMTQNLLNSTQVLRRKV